MYELDGSVHTAVVGACLLASPSMGVWLGWLADYTGAQPCVRGATKATHALETRWPEALGEALKSTCEVWMDDAWLVSNHTSITYILPVRRRTHEIRCAPPPCTSQADHAWNPAHPSRLSSLLLVRECYIGSSSVCVMLVVVVVR